MVFWLWEFRISKTFKYDNHISMIIIFKCFVESFQNHPESNLTDSITVKQYVEDLAKEDGIKNWKVLFANPNSKSELDIEYDVLKIINPGLRRTTTQITAGIMLSQRKLAPGNFDRIDFHDTDSAN